MTPALILFPRIVFALCLFSISYLKSMKKSIQIPRITVKKRKSHPNGNLLNGKFGAKHHFFLRELKLIHDYNWVFSLIYDFHFYD